MCILVRWTVAAALASAAILGLTVTKTTTKSIFQGTPVEMVTLKNKNGLELRAIAYGGTITSLKVPDRAGTLADIVLGFDDPAQYWADPPPPFFGAIIGRYGNRVAKGRFLLDGRTFTLATNNGPNHLHGGNRGFDKQLWTLTTKDAPQGASAIFTRTRGRWSARSVSIEMRMTVPVACDTPFHVCQARPSTRASATTAIPPASALRRTMVIIASNCGEGRAARRTP